MTRSKHQHGRMYLYEISRQWAAVGRRSYERRGQNKYWMTMVNQSIYCSISRECMHARTIFLCQSPRVEA